jgi:hypothetical protein
MAQFCVSHASQLRACRLGSRLYLTLWQQPIRRLRGLVLRNPQGAFRSDRDGETSVPSEKKRGKGRTAKTGASLERAHDAGLIMHAAGLRWPCRAMWLECSTSCATLSYLGCKPLLGTVFA